METTQVRHFFNNILCLILMGILWIMSRFRALAEFTVVLSVSLIMVGVTVVAGIGTVLYILH